MEPVDSSPTLLAKISPNAAGIEVRNQLSEWPAMITAFPPGWNPEATMIDFVMRLAPAQTADIWQLQDSAGTVLAAWRSDGTFWVSEKLTVDDTAKAFVESVGRVLGLIGVTHLPDDKSA